jgi:hypothetical protein
LTPPLSSPRDRSNLARKAAQARWSRVNVGQAVSLPSDSSEPQTAKPDPQKKKRKQRYSWIENRFFLSLHQDSTGQWLLRTPSGLELPASHSEISLWQDLQSLRFQLAQNQTIND